MLNMTIKQFLGLNIQEYKQLQQVELTEMHTCEDGSFGLADFQGFKKESE